MDLSAIKKMDTLEREARKYGILKEIQKNITVKKGRYNKFGGFNYRSCEDILEAVKPTLPENCLITIDSQVKEVGGRIFVRSIACLHTPYGNTITEAWAEIPDCSRKKMDEAQATGTAKSYSAKYALENLLLLDDGEDSDSLNKGEDWKKSKEEKLQEKIKKTEKEIEQCKTEKELIKLMLNLKKNDKEIYLAVKKKAKEKLRTLEEKK